VKKEKNYSLTELLEQRRKRRQYSRDYYRRHKKACIKRSVERSRRLSELIRQHKDELDKLEKQQK